MRQIDARLKSIQRELAAKIKKRPREVVLEIFDRLNDQDFRRHKDGRVYSRTERDELIKQLDEGEDELGLIEVEIIRY